MYLKKAYAMETTKLRLLLKIVVELLPLNSSIALNPHYERGGFCVINL